MGTYITEQGVVKITPEYIKVPRTWMGVRLPTWVTHLPEEVSFITVSGLDRQYVTGKRAAGVVLTGGVALLAPSRKRASIIVALRDGTVTEYTLKGSWAKKTDLIRADAAACGYRTAPTQEEG